jgi:tetratricopeptide (TPR) repeat protein
MTEFVKKKLPYVIIAGLILLIYGQTVTFHLTNLDDNVLINAIRSKSGLSVADIFISDAYLKKNSQSFYRPLQTLGYDIDNAFAPQSEWSFHLDNVLIFIIGCMVLFNFLLVLGLNNISALLLTLVFCSHPLFTQAVAWIPSRGDLLLFLFGVGSCLSFVKAIGNNSVKWKIAHAGCFLTALFAKETSVVLPLIFAGLYYEQEKFKAQKRIFFPAFEYPLIWTVAIIVYFIVRCKAMSGFPASSTFGFIPLIKSLPVLPETIGNIVLPFHLAVLPAFSSLKIITGLIVSAVLIVAYIKIKKRSGILCLTGIVWFAASQIPAMMYSFGNSSASYSYLNQRMLFPSGGILLFCAGLITEQFFEKHKKKIITIALTFTAIFSAISFVGCRVFENMKTFYEYALSTNPHSVFGWAGTGEIKQKNGDIDGALYCYDRALELDPDYVGALNNRSTIKLSRGDNNGAIIDLKRLVGLMQDNMMVYWKLARTYYKIKQFDSAVACYSEAIALAPAKGELYNERATSKIGLNKIADALEDYKTALIYNPKSGPLHCNVGAALYTLKDTCGACAEWEKAKDIGFRPADQLLEENCMRCKQSVK